MGTLSEICVTVGMIEKSEMPDLKLSPSFDITALLSVCKEFPTKSFPSKSFIFYNDDELENAEHIHNPIGILAEIRPYITYYIEDMDLMTVQYPYIKDEISDLQTLGIDANVAVSANFDQLQFLGIGPTVQVAKWLAARRALFYLIDSFISHKKSYFYTADFDKENIDNNNKSFSTLNDSAPISVSNLSNRTIAMEKSKRSSKKKGTAVSSIENEEFDPGQLNEDQTAIKIGDRAVTLAGKGPMAVLNEVHPNLAYEMLLEKGKSALETFTCKISLGGCEFFGSGRSKKLARSNAALAVLEKTYGITFGTNRNNHEDELKRIIFENLTAQEFADRLSRLVKSKFESLVVDDPVLQKRKVLAGIVMTFDWSLRNAHVICVTTGTKCINAENLSSEGNVVNDCHAEITARRCLLRFLYEELSSVCRQEHSLVLEQSHRGYKVKENVQFHLFVSTSPCGDGRVFSVHEGDQNDGTDVHPNRKARGQLRKKIEAGEGTVLINPGPYIQTWDGIISGEPLQTMSCSDKLCCWNACGLQGALLSCFIEPIYFASVTIGNLFHADHLRRALYGRIESYIDELPIGFHLNHPLLARVSYTLPRLPRKAPTSCFIWYSSGKTEILEVLNSETGRTKEGNRSKFSRCELFRLWTDLFPDISKRVRCSDQPPKLYAEAKFLAADYIQAKRCVKEAFAKAGLGLWISKPCEQDLFFAPNDTVCDRMVG